LMRSRLTCASVAGRSFAAEASPGGDNLVLDLPLNWTRGAAIELSAVAVAGLR
jgi:hypothetical protein